MSEFKECCYLPEKYLVNIHGEIKSKTGKILTTNISNSGYKFFVVKVNGKSKGFFNHRAIAFTFIPNENGYNQVNHINGIKTDNRIENLEWCTQSQNNKHAYDLGLKTYKPLHYKGKFGNEHNRSKKVVCIETGIEYGSMSEASRLLNISCSSVSWSIKYKKPIFKMHFEIAS